LLAVVRLAAKSANGDGIVGVEAVEEEFQFLGIQRVERDQLLEGVDHRQRIGPQFLDPGVVVLVQVLDMDVIRRFAGQPFVDAKPFQSLGDELQTAIVAGQLMHAGDRADRVEILRAMGFFRAVGLDQDQPDDSLLKVGGGLDGRSARDLR
jgi:hypothetical protein